MAGRDDGPAWSVVRADGTVQLGSVGVSATLTGLAHLTVRAERSTSWIGVELPDQRPDPMDMGGDGFAPEWELLSLTETSGAPLRVRVTDGGPDRQLSSRPDRRIVMVSWASPVPAGEARTLVVRWTQKAPYAALDRLATTSIARGEGSPILLALPTVTGDPGRFPYTLKVLAPQEAAVSASGSSVQTVRVEDGVLVQAAGLAGGAAVVALAPTNHDQLGAFRAFMREVAPDLVRSMANLSVPLGHWWGTPLGGLDLVQLAPGWRFPGVVAGEGVVGLRTGMRMKAAWSQQQAGVPDLPELEGVLVSEGTVAASWASWVGGDPRGRVWLEALARASALDQLSDDDALVWRRWLASCSTPLIGTRPALSPEVAATTGFRDMAARCAGQLILGPMLVDRLGQAQAAAMRRAILPRGAFEAKSLGALMLEVDPSVGPWIQRWLVEGHSVQLTARLSAVQEGDGWRTTGVVQADTDLGGAPVWIRLSRGPRVVDALVQTRGAAGVVDVATAFKPKEAEVDPDLRMLRLPIVPVELGWPSPALP